jgi:hypothetical protein
MKQCPKIGDRVRYPGCFDEDGHPYHVGPCVGTVTAIYPRDTWADDVDWDDDDTEPGVNTFPTGVAPESKWNVAVKCDERPNPWCYGDDLVFAPAVEDLQKLTKP